MKTSRFLLCALLAPVIVLPAQEVPVTPAPEITELVAAPLTEAQLDQLLAPIALYPDALIALMLPAATEPADIVLAARYLKDRGSDLSQVEHRAWDESVKSLIHYPEVVRWMDENLPWTKQVGAAFAAQPAEVMNAVQRLRARARAAGTLVDTPQQQVIAEPAVIRIVPADPEIIYVPRYDPAVVFVDRPVHFTRPLFTYAPGCRVGSWLAHDFDWHRRTLWIGDRRRPWTGRHDWRRPVVPFGTTVVVSSHYRGPRAWQPAARPTRIVPAVRPVSRPGTIVHSHDNVASPVQHYPARGFGSREQIHRDHVNARSSNITTAGSRIPRAPTIGTTPPALPAAPILPAAPTVPALQSPTFRPRSDSGPRHANANIGSGPNGNGRQFRSQPASSPASTAALPVASLHVPPPNPRSFPTVVAAAQPAPGDPPRAARPVRVAPLHVPAPASHVPATEPSAPAAASSQPSSPPASRSTSEGQRRGWRGRD